MTYASPYPNYPYSLYTQPSYTPDTAPQQQSAQQAAQPGQTGIIWVDGEVGAKAYQLPQGWPANTPMPLWDTNDTIIYLKSTNPMGMPNPLQKIYYRMEETQQTSGAAFRSAAPALKSAETYYAMSESTDESGEGMSGEGGGSRGRGYSYARYRSPRTGRYMSGDGDWPDYSGYPGGYSGRYPMPYIDPYWDRR